MTLLMGFVLILATLCWTIGSRYEWSIPLKWQEYIGSWKERLSNKSQSLSFNWVLGPNGELEKHFWLLLRELPRLQKSYKFPVCLEVQIYPESTPGQKEKYIACLQRRFSEIMIYECPLDSKVEYERG